jgi:hypothetical protein
MKIALALLVALTVTTACVAGARYKGAARSAAPAATYPDPFGRANHPTSGVFTDQAVSGKPGQE